MRVWPRSRRASTQRQQARADASDVRRAQLLTRVFDASGLAQQNEVQHRPQARREQGVRVHQDRLKIDDPVNVLKMSKRRPCRARSRASTPW